MLSRACRYSVILGKSPEAPVSKSAEWVHWVSQWFAASPRAPQRCSEAIGGFPKHCTHPIPLTPWVTRLPLPEAQAAAFLPALITGSFHAGLFVKI